MFDPNSPIHHSIGGNRSITLPNHQKYACEAHVHDAANLVLVSAGVPYPTEEPPAPAAGTQQSQPQQFKEGASAPNVDPVQEMP